jgi:hypothetical protein
MNTDVGEMGFARRVRLGALGFAILTELGGGHASDQPR